MQNRNIASYQGSKYQAQDCRRYRLIEAGQTIELGGETFVAENGYNYCNDSGDFLVTPQTFDQINKDRVLHGHAALIPVTH